MLTPNSKGNYHFIKGGAAYSSAVQADPGFSIVHLTLLKPLPIAAGFDFIARHLNDAERPPQAACSIQLRSPRPVSWDTFAEFNVSSYRPLLENYDLLVEGVSPMTRSNLAVEIGPPSEPMLYAFGYTVPAQQAHEPRDFVLAGAGDDDPSVPQTVYRGGETSTQAMRAKAIFVMDKLKPRLDELGVGWKDISVFNVYTAFDIFPFMNEVLLARLGDAQIHGVRWYFTRPPIQGLEFEADARRVSTELFV